MDAKRSHGLPATIVHVASSIDRSAVVNRVKFTPTTVADGQRTYRLEAEIALGQIASLVRQNGVGVPDGVCTLLQASFRVVAIVKRAA